MKDGKSLLETSDTAPRAIPLRILLVEDSIDDAELTLDEVRAGGYSLTCVRVDSEADMRAALEKDGWDIVLCDYSMPGFSAPRALSILKECQRDLPFIIVSGTIGEEAAVGAMKAGAHDFLVKGKLARLVPVIQRELREARVRAERKEMEERLLLSDRLVTIGTLAAGVAHEINNPLAYVIGNLEIAIDTMSSALRQSREPANMQDVLSALEQAREGAERIRLTARDLKVFGRTDDRGPEPVDVRQVIESAINMAWNQVRHRARLTKDFSPVPSVDANENKLAQVFLNLLVNAAQAIPDGNAVDNEIRVVLRGEEGNVVVEVRDTGIGIPPEVMGRLFQPFFTTKPPGVGTGLGLSICQKIVTELGGSVVASSAPGSGATFRVTLPEGTIDKRTRKDAPPAPPERRRGKVMIIDDEPSLIRLVERVLGSEHDVSGFEDAREALALLESGAEFDVILCDLMMPEMSGMDLHAALQKAVPRMVSRMVFLTGGAFTTSARQFLERIPNKRVDKPFDPRTLRATTREVMGSFEPAAAGASISPR
jgi:signal transduction histidine kinase